MNISDPDCYEAFIAIPVETTAKDVIERSDEFSPIGDFKVARYVKAEELTRQGMVLGVIFDFDERSR